METKQYKITLSVASAEKFRRLGGTLSNGIELAAYFDAKDVGLLHERRDIAEGLTAPAPLEITKEAQKVADAAQKVADAEQARFDKRVRDTPLAEIMERISAAKGGLVWCAEHGKDDSIDRSSLARYEKLLTRRKELFPDEAPEQPVEPTLNGKTIHEWHATYLEASNHLQLHGDDEEATTQQIMVDAEDNIERLNAMLYPD